MLRFRRNKILQNGIKTFLIIPICASFIMTEIATAFAEEEYRILKRSEINCDLFLAEKVPLLSDGRMDPDKTKVDLICEGKKITLVDKKIVKGWLMTKDFGKIKVVSDKNDNHIYVTHAQKEKLRLAVKKPLKTTAKTK